MAGPLRFDYYLPSLRSDELRRMAALWGAGGQTRKDALISTISQGLADPNQVRMAVARLTPIEQAALAFLRRNGGVMSAGHLLAALRTAGHAPSPAESEFANDQLFIRRLIERGLVLTSHPGDSTYYSSYSGSLLLFTDERLLAVAGAPEVVPLELASRAAPAETRMRRAPTVMLDLLGMIQSIETNANLQLTRSGAVRVSDLRRLAKSQGWDEDEARFDGMLFRQPTIALVDALLGAGVLQPSNSALRIAQPDEIAQLPVERLVARLLAGFCRTLSWCESPNVYFHESLASRFNAMRGALLTALACLPEQPDAFYTIDELSRGLFERIGYHHSLTGLVMPMYYSTRQPKEEQRRLREQRAESIRTSWEQNENPWLVYALAGWLYYLGIVEVGIEDGAMVCFRLTSLGFAALHPELSAQAIPAAEGPAWLIQPDFEVVVYLDHAMPTQIALIERIAERAGVAAHVARYRLTRDSIYQALERGTAITAIIDGLAAGSGGPIPQNVLATIRDWAAQRDRVTLRRRAGLLEFPTPAARDTALSDGIGGMPIGERFVLLDPHPGRLPQHEVINYALPPAISLSAGEDGWVKQVRAVRDLFTRPLIDRWAEPAGDGIWRLTAASVAAAGKRGWTGAAILQQFNQRLTHSVPPLLAVAIRAWAGGRVPASLGRVTLLRFEDAEITQAVGQSERFQPYILASLGPQALLVDTAKLDELREALRWAGITPTESGEQP